ncbi:MAG: DUF4351 domain-containing protein [Byssovorax sp.]
MENEVMNWFEQEMAKKQEQGREQGREEGERLLLLKLLRRRFGELPAAIVARVEAARAPDLETWGERILSASRLEEVLG